MRVERMLPARQGTQLWHHTAAWAVLGARCHASCNDLELVGWVKAGGSETMLRSRRDPTQ